MVIWEPGEAGFAGRKAEMAGQLGGRGKSVKGHAKEVGVGENEMTIGV